MSEKHMSTGETIHQPAATKDFFRHINHDWLQSTEIPESESIWGSFAETRVKTYQQLRDIADDLQSQNPEKGSTGQQVRDFYRSGMDLAKRNELGLQPIAELRDMVSGISSRDDLAPALAEMRLKGFRPFFSSYFWEDLKIAGSNAHYMEQGGLGMPNREYYLSEDESKQEIRHKYVDYISKLFQLSGKSAEDADAAAANVYQVEHILAEASKPEAEIRERDKNYHKFTLDQAVEQIPGIDWRAYFATLGKPGIKDFVLEQPDFMKVVGNVLQDTDLDAVKDYLDFRLLNHMSPMLSQDFVDENFAFYKQALSGVKEQNPTWRNIIETLHSTDLTDAIGPLYCERHFNQEKKTRIMAMVSDITDAFRDRVATLDWMDEQTKALTIAKLDNITFKMGFPDEWKDISNVDIRDDSYVQNIMNLSENSFTGKLADLEEPYDRTEWAMPPTLVNACSDLKREMTFPAAILQFPFYDEDRDDAYNYGGIGMVVGHELSHFFDDQGCKFDVDGNMKDWWTEDVRDAFKALAQKYVEYYNGLTSEGLQVDGQLTLGENIADDAGIGVSFEALRRSMARGENTEIVDGLTPEQRFFTGYALIWQKKIRPELAQQYILIDPHSPADVRVNGILAINQQFHEAFDVREGDAMYVAPADRPVLW